MLAFAHLCIGAIAGLFFARLTGHRFMVLIGMAASILPDVVDKPLEAFGQGSLPGYDVPVLHSLIALAILCGVVVLAYRFLAPPLPAVMALILLAVGLHQLMDVTMASPEKWLYPFHESFPPSLPLGTPLSLPATGPAPEAPAGYARMAVLEELLSTSEWIFAGVVALILLAPRIGERAIRWGAGLLAVLALATLASFANLAGLPVPVIDAGHRCEELLLAVSAAGALALWYYDRGEREGGERTGGTGEAPP